MGRLPLVPPETSSLVHVTDRGPVQQISNGHWFYTLDPRPEEVWLTDVAISLPLLNRFLGHTTFAYGVAQHSVLASYVLEDAGYDLMVQLQGLMHDAHEFVTGDIVRPIKHALDQLSQGIMRKITDPIDVAISTRFGMDYPFHAAIKWADATMLATEKRDILIPSPAHVWRDLPLPMKQPITHGWSEYEARRIFLDRFHSLYQQIHGKHYDDEADRN